jgi:hypothetical protein
MPYTIDTASEIHNRQVAAMETLQSTLVKAVDVLSDVRSKAPQAPEQLTDAAQKIAAPLTKVVGTPSELHAHAVAISRDWFKVQNKFQTALLDAVFPSGVTVEVPAPTTRKKATASEQKKA